MPYAQVAGWGKYVPTRVVTNDSLVQGGLDTTDEWITSRTGIKQRRLIAQGEATSDMALKAGQQALAVAGVSPGEIDLIIVATCTPDHLLPATASLVQERIGAFRAGAMDINAVCSGFVYGLVVAAGQIEAGRARRVLVIGADTLSPYVDWQDRNTCVLFGDGAGAVLLAASTEPGILAGSLGSDGSGADLLMLPAGGSRQPPNSHALVNGDHHIKMNGPQVFRFATQMLAKSGERVVAASGLRMRDIDLLVPHQANLRIIETTAKKLRVPMEKVFVNVDRYGNTSAASIPIAFCEAIEEGRVKAGDHVLLASFGAGLTWAATVVRWGLARRAPSLLARLRTALAFLASAVLRRGRRARRHIPLP
ncbi:MAG TPA: beta-ketoacyl-ACP synthase III [Dehalococcoidia bacterium]|nr:beta-ketoacyl-ACP synthase III [Dehalococcoidia bacterium]